MKEDGKNTPYKNLPFYLTTIIFPEINLISLVSKFANNLTHYQSPYDETYTMDYTYNTADLPLTATMYTDYEGQRLFETRVEYNYIVKKIK